MLKPIMVACGAEDHIGGRAVWGSCDCGQRICHDPIMEANIQARYPGAEIHFACMACMAERVAAENLAPEKIARDSEALMPEEGRGLRVSPGTLDKYIKSFRRN